eukprot:3473499-Rhodomonas_salina.1
MDMNASPSAERSHAIHKCLHGPRRVRRAEGVIHKRSVRDGRSRVETRRRVTDIPCARILQRAKEQVDKGGEQERGGDIALFDATTQPALGRLSEGVGHSQPRSSKQILQHGDIGLRDAELSKNYHQRPQVGRIVGID